MLAYGPTASTAARLDVHDLNLASDAKSTICHCSLLLPELNGKYQHGSRLEIGISGDRSAAWIPHDSLNVPFYTSHWRKVIEVTFEVTFEIGPTSSCIMILPVSTVLDHVGLDQTGDIVCVAWEEWGPRNTRFLQSSRVAAHWHRRTFGQAVVTLGTQHQMLNYHDFNQQILKHDFLSTQDEAQISPETSTVEAEVFDRPVATTLPCRVKTITLPRRGPGSIGRAYSSIMLSEDALVGVSVGFRLSFSHLSGLLQRLYQFT